MASFFAAFAGAFIPSCGLQLFFRWLDRRQWYFHPDFGCLGHRKHDRAMKKALCPDLGRTAGVRRRPLRAGSATG